MSFDFMVFDADAAPTNGQSFKAWFETELELEPSYNCAVPEKDAFRHWYEQMREIFTPFNGPDDVPLPDQAPKARLLRTCEYSFRPHSAYLSFRHGAKDMARAVSSTLAREFALGYYHVSVAHGQAVFPDGTTIWPTGKY